MHVLVTGGAGYVGYSVVAALAKSEAVSAITVYDNLARGEAAIFSAQMTGGRGHFRKGDILDARTLERALAGVDAVVHLAAAVHRPDRDQDAHVFDQVNNWGSAQLATAIEASDSVERVIYLSSVSVYGGGPAAFDDEATPHPTSFYAVTKLRGEAHLRRLADTGRRVHVVRSGNVFGFNRAVRFEGVINRFVFDAKYSGRVRIEGSGVQTRPFIEVGLLGDELVRLLVGDLPSSTLNFVQRNASVIELFELVRGLRPDLEALFLDQDMQMAELRVEPSDSFLAERRGDDDLEAGVEGLWRALEL